MHPISQADIISLISQQSLKILALQNDVKALKAAPATLSVRKLPPTIRNVAHPEKYLSVQQYVTSRFIKLDLQASIRVGTGCLSTCQRNNIEIKQALCNHGGAVNSYPVSVIARVLSENNL